MGRRLTLGLLLIAAGFVTAGLIAVPRFLDVGDRISSFPKTRLSEGSVVLEVREYDVFLEVPSGTADAGWTGPSIRDPAGRQLALRTTSSSITYDWFGRQGTRIGKLRVTTAGRHAVRGTGPPGADLVFADNVIGDMGRSILFALGALGVLGSAGVILIVMGVAKRPSREPKHWP